METVIRNLESCIDLTKQAQHATNTNRELLLREAVESLATCKAEYFEIYKQNTPTYRNLCSIIHHFTMITHGQTNGTANTMHDIAYHKHVKSLQKRLDDALQTLYYKLELSEQKKEYARRSRQQRADLRRSRFRLVG